jgi:hypothetical protein
MRLSTTRPDISRAVRRAEIIEKFLRTSERYPVRTYTDMKKTIHSLIQQFLTGKLSFHISRAMRRAELIEKFAKTSERYPVRTYTDMKKTMHSLMQQFLTDKLSFRHPEEEQHALYELDSTSLTEKLQIIVLCCAFQDFQ